MSDPFDMESACPASMTILRAGSGIARAPAGIANGPFLAQMLLSSKAEGEMTAMRAFIEPGIVTHWHMHPSGQLLYVLDGVGLAQRDEEDVSFVLPADYDTTVIDRRIPDRGPLLDDFPQLRFKAYLSARKQDNGFTSAENLYAPFYLWDEPEGLDAFLTDPGFAAVTRDFGWPIVAGTAGDDRRCGTDLCGWAHVVTQSPA